MESKSILRAVAGQIATIRGYVDYFPSYELINSPAFGGIFFDPNKRTVSRHGVRFVMDSFFSCMTGKFGQHTQSKGHPGDASDAICEEELLGAFGK